MAKQRISKVLDTLETLADIPKRAVKDTLKTFNPLDALNNPSGQTQEMKTNGEQQGKIDHTPLKLDKVAGKHELTDLELKKKAEEQRKLAEVRSKLFHQVKGDEKQAIYEQEKVEKEKKEVELTEEQRKQEDLKRRLAAHNTDAPQGREKKGGLFAPKRKKRTANAIAENQVEMRGSGKH